jgi:hypothetical protein
VDKIFKPNWQNKEANVDVDIDYKTCELIAGEAFEGQAGVIEGRQPAFMGMYLRESFQKQNLVSLYLVCNLRERALRYLLREVGPEARQMADERMPPEQQSTASEDIVRLRVVSSTIFERLMTVVVVVFFFFVQASISAYAKHIAELPLPNIEKIAAEFYENQVAPTFCVLLSQSKHSDRLFCSIEMPLMLLVINNCMASTIVIETLMILSLILRIVLLKRIYNRFVVFIEVFFIK